ncbi:MAG TPA: LTA synthase family protein [Steroidobacteraceae bacterium]|nr:LTA synthase family protein [Steroidobacteraceae bacterium]
MNHPPEQSLVRRSGPVGVLFALFLVCLLWLSIARGALLAMNWSRLYDEPALWRMFAMGLRMDTIVICQLFAIPAILYLLLPGKVVRERLVAVLLTLAAGVLIVMEICTPNFMAEFDRRPDRVYYEYLRYPHEVFGTLLKTYPVQLVVAALLIASLTFSFWWLTRRRMSVAADWSWPARLLAFPVMAVLLFGGIRSSLGHRPANLSTAAYSGNHLVNELAASSTYTLFTAIYMSRNEADAAALYARMDRQDVLTRVRKYTGTDLEYPVPDIPTLHRQPAAISPPSKPPNVVIVLMESLGAGFVGGLGGLPLTPNIDRLSSEGLSFTQLYATGTRTVRGLEAVITGFPPTASASVLKLPAAQGNFFTLARLLREHGYATQFVYGGVSNFDNMGKFFRENGFDTFIEQKDFKDPALLGTWGVSDEDLVVKAHELFQAQQRPFFSVLLTTSNHVPFEFPQGRIKLHEEPAGTRNNAVKYTDYAIGKLFELARTAPYFENTIFLVVADHDARVFGEDLVPIDRFRIPGFIIGPGVPRRHEDRVASQIDLAPTLLGLLGIETTHPMIGRDVLHLAADAPGRAIMQYGDANGFRVGDKVVVHQPHMSAETFLYKDGRLLPTEHDVELERDALAHLLWADTTYRERQYRLPKH